jgi:hypothetical protein
MSKSETEKNMTRNQRNQIRQYMMGVAEEHRDPKTGKINMTQLAEDAANFSPVPFDTLPGCDEYSDIPEAYFELAYEVTSRLE